MTFVRFPKKHEKRSSRYWHRRYAPKNVKPSKHRLTVFVPRLEPEQHFAAPPQSGLFKFLLIHSCSALLVKIQMLSLRVDELMEKNDHLEAVLQNAQEMRRGMDLNALPTAEIVGHLGNDRCIVRMSTGSRMIVDFDKRIKIEWLTKDSRVALDAQTLTILVQLPRQVEVAIYTMSTCENIDVPFEMIGGLQEQIRSIREVIELPLTKPELFKRLGIKAPKGILLYGPPGTGKTLLAKAVACEVKCNFLKVCSSSIIDKYIGESARIIREMFAYAKAHKPCVIFFDEIDAVGAKRSTSTGSADREVQRCLLELLHQMDGFDYVDRVNVIMATNRPDILDAALLRPGRLDRKIEVPLPNLPARCDILKIHSKTLNSKGDLKLQLIADLTEGLNGADLRCVCSEAGYWAIKKGRMHIVHDDLVKGAQLVNKRKKLEVKCDFQPPGQSTKWAS